MRLQEFTQLDEIRKGQKDSNGFSKCWPGYHAQGTKTGKHGSVRNCVKNEDATVPQQPRDPNRMIATISMVGDVKEMDLTGKFQGDVKQQMSQASDLITDFCERNQFPSCNIVIRFQGKIMRTNYTSADLGQQVNEMPAHLRNDPDGPTIIPHGGMGSGKEDTWRNLSIRKLEQAIEMIKTGNYTGAEHTVYKNGFLEGAVRALARYEEFKQKQGRRPLAKGREVDLG